MSAGVEEIVMLTPRQAAARAGVTARHRRIENRSVTGARIALLAVLTVLAIGFTLRVGYLWAGSFGQESEGTLAAWFVGGFATSLALLARLVVQTDRALIEAGM